MDEEFIEKFIGRNVNFAIFGDVANMLTGKVESVQGGVAKLSAPTGFGYVDCDAIAIIEAEEAI